MRKRMALNFQNVAFFRITMQELYLFASSFSIKREKQYLCVYKMDSNAILRADNMYNVFSTIIFRAT